MGESWLFDDERYKSYYKKEIAILSKVFDKDSADTAAKQIKTMRLLPENEDLRLTYSLLNIYVDLDEYDRIAGALFFGSADLAKLLCGEQYKFYLLENTELTEDAVTAISKHLLSEIGNITKGGPGFTSDTAWQIDEFRDNIPFLDNIEMKPESLFIDAFSWITNSKITEEGMYVEYTLIIIFNDKKHKITQWFVAPHRALDSPSTNNK